MSKVQLYAVNPDGETVLLQLSEDSPVKMNLSVAEINPFTPSSFFSQTFRLPGIGRNTQFFQDVYSVNGSTFNPAAAAQAWILSDGALFSLGNLNLQAVYTNELSGTIEYDVYFLGDTSNLSTQIGEGGMNTIDAAELNHPLTYANVTGSWAATGGATAGLKDGNVLYPLCEWGYTYGTGPNEGIPIQSTLSNGYAKSFTIGATSAIEMEQMKPGIRVKWLLDKIMSDAGYVYESAFLESDYFQSLYFMSDVIARPAFENPSGICQITTSPFSVNQGAEVVIPFDNAISNIDQAFNTTTHVWTAPVTGTFTFTASGQCFVPAVDETTNDTFGPAAFVIVAYKNDVSIFTSTIQTTTLANPRNWSWSSGSLSLTLGDRIYVSVRQMIFSNPLAEFQNSQFNCLTGPNQVVMSSFLPDETILKKIDFIRSLVRMFNLVFEPSRVTQKTFVIEPWIDWVQSGEIRDWTRLYDGSADLQSSPVFAEQQRILKFGAEQDEDWLNKQYQEQNKADYWYRQFDSGIKLIREEQEVDVQFGANPLQSIPSKTTQYPNWVFPTLGRLQPGNPNQPNSARIEPIVPRPRIYHYNGLQSNPTPWYLFDQVSGGGTGQAQNSYPLISPYSSWPPDQFTTVNLNFQSKVQPWSADSSLIGQTSQDLYTVYWAEYVSWLYDPFNRKVSLTLRLDPADVQELAFNDRIWIKDTWYFIQKISDYVIGQTVLVRVDLVKVPPVAIPGPIPLAATGGTGGTTCRTISLCNNNAYSETGQSTYTYVDCLSNIASVTLPDSSCAAPICMLFPLVNALPSGWTASDNGSCGSTGAALEIRMVNQLESLIIEYPFTTVEVQGASGGTGGTYTTIQNFTFDGDQDFTVSIPNLPTGFGLRVRLSSSYAPGTALVSQFISLATNGTTGATAGRSGTYQPISATFPAVVSASNTYTAYVNITY
jgi:hypothetical protein